MPTAKDNFLVAAGLRLNRRLHERDGTGAVLALSQIIVVENMTVSAWALETLRLAVDSARKASEEV